MTSIELRPLDKKSSSINDWSIPNAQTENSRSLPWPIHFLPDRYKILIKRKLPMRIFEDMIAPSSPPTYTSIINEGTEGSVGKTEELLEHCYRSIVSGSYAAIVWLPSSDESSFVSSCRYLVRRIKISDPSFGRKLNCDIETVESSVLI